MNQNWQASQTKAGNDANKLPDGLRVFLGNIADSPQSIVSNPASSKNQIAVKYSQQSAHSFKSIYPSEWECMHTTAKGKNILVRPIKISDEGRIQIFFSNLSEENMYMRYFSPLKSVSQKFLKNICNIDYSRNMTLVALSPSKDGDYEIIGIGQWVIDMVDHLPEIAFQIRDDWQGEGLGTYFFYRLLEISGAYRISKFKAEVLTHNTAMNRVFEKVGIPFKRYVEFGVYSYLFDLNFSEAQRRIRYVSRIRNI